MESLFPYYDLGQRSGWQTFSKPFWKADTNFIIDFSGLNTPLFSKEAGYSFYRITHIFQPKFVGGTHPPLLLNWSQAGNLQLMNIRQFIPLANNELFKAAVVFLCALVFVMGSRLVRLSNTNSIYSEEPVHIYLDAPTTLNQLSKTLVDSGLVESREELLWAGRLLGWNRLRTGHYLVEGGYSYDVFLSRMARGIQDPIDVTIIPGLNRERITQSLSSSFSFDSSAFAETVTDSSFWQQQGIEMEDWLGRMLPESYSMYWTAKPPAVVKRILREFQNLVIERYADRLDELDKTVDEIVTLASIIEWEARHDEERATISGLYWNRLESGMRLQADPTVNYAIGERRRLLYEDYKVDHPYNTYMNDGLPPGPITNPSLKSIEAALYPEDHDYLYMVATPEGYHLFSETFEEHKKKSEEWRKWLREQYRLKEEREREKAQGTS